MLTGGDGGGGAGKSGYAPSAVNVIDGGDGDDVITGGNIGKGGKTDGSVYNGLYGGVGNDIITAGVGFNIIDGGVGADKIYAAQGTYDRIYYDRRDKVVEYDVGLDKLIKKKLKARPERDGSTRVCDSFAQCGLSLWVRRRAQLDGAVDRVATRRRPAGAGRGPAREGSAASSRQPPAAPSGSTRGLTVHPASRVRCARATRGAALRSASRSAPRSCASRAG